MTSREALPRLRVAVLAVAVLAMGCGGEEDDAGSDGDSGSDPVLEAAEFCSSSAGTQLELLGEKANRVDFSTGRARDPEQALEAIDRIMALSVDAPAGADCAYNALDRAADAYRTDVLPDSAQGLREVQQFQREHDLTLADALSLGE